VRNALGRFERVRFEDDAARERARRRLLNAAKKYGIVPVGFITGQLRSERTARTPDFSTYPRGSVTFLMTDIEGSTELLRELGEEYTIVLRDVRTVVRTSVRRCGGHKVDATGDEFLSVFERTAQALEAAIDLQREMAARIWPQDRAVRVRAGIHSGRPSLTENGYVGIAVNTVSRVCNLGHGGQIVITTKAKTALEGSTTTGTTFRRLGRAKLAGLPQPETLYQVNAKDLVTRFPPLRMG
jgi:class 3 adenylate cyclase